MTKSIDNFLRARGMQICLFASCNRCSEQKRKSLTSNNPIAEHITEQPTANNLSPDNDGDVDLLTRKRRSSIEIR